MKIWKRDCFSLIFAPASDKNNRFEGAKKGSEKFFRKIFQKDLVVIKKGFTFAPLSALKNERSAKTELFFYSIYSRTAFFEVFEQLKVSTLARE